MGSEGAVATQYILEPINAQPFPSLWSFWAELNSSSPSLVEVNSPPPKSLKKKFYANVN